jgi:hypothetical protein
MQTGTRSPNGVRRFKKISFSLNGELYAQSRTFANDTGDTFSGLIAKALVAYMAGANAKTQDAAIARVATLETRYDGLAAALDEVRALISKPAKGAGKPQPTTKTKG